MYIYVCLWIMKHKYTHTQTSELSPEQPAEPQGVPALPSLGGNAQDLTPIYAIFWGTYDDLLEYLIFFFSHSFFFTWTYTWFIEIVYLFQFSWTFFWSIPLGIDNLPFLFTKACPYVCWFNPHHSWRPPNFASNCGYFRHFKALKVAVLRYNSTLGWF